MTTLIDFTKERERRAAESPSNGGSEGTPSLDEASRQIARDIDEWAKGRYASGHRTHLGASAIGGICEREVWYSFRWVLRETFPGRILRLFQRGHREERVFEEYLKGIGAQVSSRDPATGRQYTMSGVDGHYGGSLDGQAILPAKYGISGPILLEYKTKGSGAGFTKLQQQGVKAAEPRHWSQMCAYGEAYGLTHALYMTVCKDNDELHVELVKLDHEHGRDMRDKAAGIIGSQEPPQRMSDNYTHFYCRSFCNYRQVCHKGAKVEKNCRSCGHAEPAEGRKWYCNHHRDMIPQHIIPSGCDGYSPIVNGWSE